MWSLLPSLLTHLKPMGQLQRSYGTIAVLSASRAAADGRRTYGTVAPHPESECSGKAAAFVHPTRAQLHHARRPYRLFAAAPRCAGATVRRTRVGRNRRSKRVFTAAGRIGACKQMSRAWSHARRAASIPGWRRHSGVARLARHAACPSASRMSIHRRTAGFDPTQVVVAKEKPPR